MRPQERSIGAALLAVLAIAGLAVAWTAPWFEYDSSTGRQTAPDGAYNRGEDGIIRHHLTYFADHWTGDVAPDAALADRLAIAVPVLLAIGAGALLLVALGEIPAIHRVIRRPVALGLVVLALAAIATAAVLAWVWMPESMAAHGADSQFTARLEEERGYVITNLMWGWYATAASLIPVIGAGLFKFQAGQVDLDSVSGLLRTREGA